MMCYIRSKVIMKKIFIFAILFFIVMFVVLSKIFSPPLMYETGTDTHDYFGDGQYQLLTSINDGKEKYSLFNVKYHISIIDNVVEYDESDNAVYFYGEHQGNTVYVYLYLNNNNIVYCQPYGELNILYANDMMKEGKLEIITDLSVFEEKIK